MDHEVSSSLGRGILRQFASKNPIFTCIISYTATSEIPGITIAGASPEMIQYTSPADAEFLYYGHCKCIGSVPATPDGKPTPALITRTALQLGNIPALIVDAGSKVKPSIPLISLGLSPGKNIELHDAMSLSDVKQAVDHGRVLGKELAKLSDMVVIGESIPAGTTTALAVLVALGIDAKFRIGSSMPANPHELKNKVVSAAMKRAGVRAGDIGSPLEAISLFGDPMMPALAGVAEGALSEGGKVVLAGGTQMAVALSVLKMNGIPMKRLCVGSTRYIARDSTSDLSGLVKEIAPGVPLLYCDLHLDRSSKPGLRAFAEGFVKEGVGAGGASIAAMLGNRKITGKKFLHALEKEYESSIEAALKRKASSL